MSEKGDSESVNALIHTLSMDSSTEDLEQFATLSQSVNISSDIDNQASEEETSTVHVEEAEDDDLVQTELGAHEIEIEMEHDPEEILPEAKAKTVPPLRPLTIAPKPTKMPIAIKPVAGQQLLLVQGNGQQFKLLPQTINLSNLQLGKPLQHSQTKQVVMTKVIQPNRKPTQIKTYDNKQVVIVQKADSQGKILGQTSSTPTKTITLAEAQEIGLLTSAKLLPQGTSTPKQTILLNKSQPKGIRLVRSPTKILPAPQTSTSTKQPQRIILKSTTSSALITPSQLIQVGNQPITAGQIHQINIPGKGVQYIKFITTQTDTSNTSTTSSTKPAPTVTVGSKIVTLGGSALSDSGNIVLSEVKPVSKTSIIAPKPTKSVIPIQTSTVMNNSSGQLLMVPASYLHRTSTPKVPIPVRSSPVKQANTDAVVPVANEAINLESNGMRPRKPCNCTKSQCLKLYCDCFANGEFCYMCNCMNCFNNLENEEHRQRAIKNCLDRNPNAFRPKIGKSKESGDMPVRKHTKGCNCKRSGCLKNYCECYEAKIACSSNCKCIGCRNIEDTMEKKNVRPQSVEVVFGKTPSLPNKAPSTNDNVLQIRPKKTTPNKLALNNLNVIEATMQCLLALAHNAEANGESEEEIQRRVIEECGKCLTEIIDCSKNKNLIDN